MTLLKNNYDLSFLENEFSNIAFSMYRLEKRVSITCFVCTFSSDAELLENWRDISSLIAANYQNTLENDFEKWNIYLVLMVNEIITNELKYQIENDRFAVRKIVIDSKGFKSAPDEVEKLLNELILGEDLKRSEISHGDKQELILSNKKKYLIKDGVIPLDGKQISIEIREKWIHEILEKGIFK